MSELRVFIGWDDREKVAYDVCKFSLDRYKSGHVRVIPLYHKELRKQGFFQRPWFVEALTGNRIDMLDGKPFSTEFSHSRFLVPELMGFKGWALFLDCDMLFKCDVKEIFQHADDRYAVMCVKHRQKVSKSLKMDGSPQQGYFRKNWSSFMLINCSHPSNKFLTKEMVNTATGNFLHTFSWLKDNEIGDLPASFNWIDGSSPGNVNPKVIHYSEGGPWFRDYQDCMFADDWWRAYKEMNKEPQNPAADMCVVNYRNI
jgi:lipopolysaccharide biosynthesis glycosyltransferase